MKKETTQELNAKFFKRIDKIILKNTNYEIGAFALYFELLANLVKKNPDDPTQIFMGLIQEESKFEKSFQLYTDYHNAIVAKYEQFSNGKNFNYLHSNLYNLAYDFIPEQFYKDESFDEEYRQGLLLYIVQPINKFLSSHDIELKSTIPALQNAIKEKFDNHYAISESIELLLSFYMMVKNQDKEIEKIFNPFSLVNYMIEESIKLSIEFIKIRKDCYTDSQPQLKVENYTSVMDENELKFSQAQRNDKCPCGSGKKYKNCCKKGWDYPLSTLKPQKILAPQKLKIGEVQQYYKLYNKLMSFVQNDYAKKYNKKSIKNIFEIQYDGSYACNNSLLQNHEIIKIREHLIANRELVEKFIQNEGILLDEEDKAIFTLWKNFLYLKDSIVMQKHNDSEIFLWNIQTQQVYLIYGLYDPIASIIPSYPFYGNFLLFPYKGHIIFDGLLTGNDMDYGNNILRTFIKDYQDNILKNGITLRI